MRSMGIGDGTRIVVYDQAGLFSAARVWWTFRVMGHDDVTVLNGGLPKWKREGLPLESGEPTLRSTRHFTSRRNSRPGARRVRHQIDSQGPIRRRSSMPAAPSASPGVRRSRALGLRSGHIPGARNLPYGKLLKEDGTLKSPAQIEKLFKDAGVDLGKPVVDELRLGHHRKRTCSGAG